LLPMVVSL